MGGGGGGVGERRYTCKDSLSCNVTYEHIVHQLMLLFFLY